MYNDTDYWKDEEEDLYTDEYMNSEIINDIEIEDEYIEEPIETEEPYEDEEENEIMNGGYYESRPTWAKKKEIKEEVDIKSIIDEVIDTNWSGSNDEQLKAVQLLKGLSTSDDPLSNKFMKALDDATSKMNKDDFKK